jgi:anti-repressor protein
MWLPNHPPHWLVSEGLTPKLKHEEVKRKMNELIKVDYSNQEPTVSGRELHAFLEVKSKYGDWFHRMREYGFTEGIDFILVAQKRETNNTKNPYTEYLDHQLTIPMAKELCMIQRTEKGKIARQYFLYIEKAWKGLISFLMMLY